MIRTLFVNAGRATLGLLIVAVAGCAGGWRNAPAASGSATPPQAAATAASTTNAAGTKFVYKGDGNSVALAGEFNNWNTSADPLAKQPDGSWVIVKQLAPGRYMYKYVVDGSNWKTDDAAKESADDGLGGKNSIVVVGAGAAATPAAATTPAASQATGDGTRFVYKGDGNTVALAGEFNNWNTSSDPLTKQADGSWVIVKKLDSGRYMYKFVVDGTNWKPDDLAKESADDGFGGKNSIVVVGAGAAAAPTMAATTPAAQPAASQATGSGTRFVYKGSGNTVALAGEFNNWNTSADPLAKQPDGSWVIVKKLDAGRYMYKFVVDGTNWKPDDLAKESADDGFGGKNSIVVVEGGAGAGAATPTPAASTSVAVTGKGAPPKVTPDGVKFTFAGAADQVVLAGDFNSWSTSTDPLVRQADGTWVIVRKTPPGTYGYKFLVNGKTWKQDESNPEAKDDGFGGKNSIVTVP